MDILAAFLDVALRFFDIVLHVDKYLIQITAEYGIWIYLLIFVIIFCETGLVVTPVLPGDSLLFAAGTLAGVGSLSYFALVVVILGAAVLGDSVNYRIGRYFGPPVFEKDRRFLRRDHLLQAQAFYERHGGKAIILARFVPLVRTFAPFVAGVAGMHQGRFLFFNIAGAGLWVFGLVSAGFLLGNMPLVQKNFSVIVYGIVAVSVLPVVIGWAKSKIGKKAVQLNSK